MLSALHDAFNQKKEPSDSSETNLLAVIDACVYSVYLLEIVK